MDAFSEQILSATEYERQRSAHNPDAIPGRNDHSMSVLELHTV